MGVIKLDGYFLWKQIQIVPGDLAASKLGSFEATDDILQICIKLMHLSFAGNKFKLCHWKKLIVFTRSVAETMKYSCFKRSSFPSK